MSDTPKSTVPPLDSVTVTRNETALPFINTVIKRGPAESRGKQYLAPDVNKDNVVSLIIPWMGIAEAAAVLAAHLRKKAQGWFEENVEDDGTFVKEGFIEMASTYSARGESIPDLLKEIDELSGQQQDMLNADDFGTPESIAQVKALASKIIGLRAAIDNKRRMTKEEKAAAEAAKTAQAAA
jgi:hypothetical protein